ncbi:uncharacterized protein METZ01_LOCUS386458, partial [marine metagenome]
NGWPLSLSDLSGNQYYESSTLTEYGVFVSFKNNTSGDYDVYSQYILFTGSLWSGSSGTAIASGVNDELSSSVAYNPAQDKVIVCYEVSDGSETDIHCNEINLPTTVSGTIIISEYPNNQNNPFVYWSGQSFMITWEDSRNSTVSNPEQDIYFQEFNNGNISLTSGGEAITTFTQKQERPIISKYSDTTNQYVILWEDYRSTGKEYCANLYGQSFTYQSCAALGDMNNDGSFDVLDIVTLAGCVLAENCPDLPNGCAGNMNGDASFDVLDIVTLASCVLAENCGN